MPTISPRLYLLALLALILNLFFIPTKTQAWNTPVSPVKYTAWTWTGAIDNDWNKGGNWCGSYINGQCRGQTSPPSSTSTVVLTNACTTNCAPTLSSDVSIYALNLSNFSGSLNQGSYKMSIGLGGYFMDSGTYNHGSADIEIGSTTAAANFRATGGTFNGGTGNIYVGLSATPWTVTGGRFDITAANFRSTSGILRLQVPAVNISSASTFNPNGGTLQIEAPLGGNNSNIYRNLNHLVLRVGAFKAINFLADVTVNGDLTFNGANSSGGTVNFNKIYLANGNVFHTGYDVGGDTLIKLTKSSGQQIVDGSGAVAGYPYMPGIEVEQPSSSSSVKFVGEIGVSGSFIAKLSQGNYVTTGATFRVKNTTATPPTYDTPQFSLPTLTFESATSVGFSLGTMNVGNFIITSNNDTVAYTGSAGVINVSGNYSGAGQIASAGSAFLVNLNGGSAQTVDASASTYGWLPALRFANTSGGVSFVGNAVFTGSLEYISGGVTIPTYLRLRSATTSDIALAGVSIPNILIDAGCKNLNFTQDIATSGLLQFYNKSAGYNMNGSRISVSGDVTNTTLGRGMGGTATIVLTGSANQKIDGTFYAGDFTLPNVEIASSGGTVRLLGSLSTAATYTYTSGNVDGTASTYTFTNGVTITPGPTQFGNVSFLPFSSYYTLTGAPMIVRGNLTIGSSANGGKTINGQSIEVYGNVDYTLLGHAGSTVIKMKGTTNTTFSQASTATTYLPSNIQIEKTGGAKVTAITPISFGTSKALRVVSGQFDLGATANNLIMATAGTLTLDSGTTLKLSGATVTVNGSDVPAGAYSSGTIIP